LHEKARRHFLGQEYLSLGVGSQRYLSRVFNCSPNTIDKGKKEVVSTNFEPDYTTQRQEGGGKKEEELTFLTTLILDFVSQHTAGSPTDPAVKWTALRPLDIAINLNKLLEHFCPRKLVTIRIMERPQLLLSKRLIK